MTLRVGMYQGGIRGYGKVSIEDSLVIIVIHSEGHSVLLRGITRVTTWVVGVINLLTKSP